ncbi:hypothetical protein CMMCAS05_05685 [Clavibacter michiganensis subsp. michiganensis]|nr:hypothetical protein CMMCAS05_05685 [Clavibacter michiganensis subsp. michiganensis]
MSDSTPPSDSASWNTRVPSTTRRAAFAPPRTWNEIMPPKPVIWALAMSWPGCSGRPG